MPPETQEAEVVATKRTLNPDTKAINIVLRAKGPLKLFEVREGIDAIEKDPDIGPTLDSPKMDVDWDMTFHCKDAGSLASMKKIIAEKGGNNAIYIPIKLRSDSLQVVKEKVMSSKLT
jgi:hypothetical protein